MDTKWKKQLQPRTVWAALVIAMLMLPNLAFGQTVGDGGGGEIPSKILALAMWVYNNLRWPVSFLGLTIAVGMARFRDDGVRHAIGVGSATIAWALVPAGVQVLKSLFG